MTLNDFNCLNLSQKENFCHQISAKYPKFSFVKMANFKSFGREFETGVFSFEGDEFVFIPANKAVLGWADFSEPLEPSYQEKLENELKNYGCEQNLREYIDAHTSPLRTAKIPPMLAERKPTELGWFEVALDDERLEEYADEIAKFKRGEYGKELIINTELRLICEDDTHPKPAREKSARFFKCVKQRLLEPANLAVQAQTQILAGQTGGANELNLAKYCDKFKQEKEQNLVNCTAQNESILKRQKPNSASAVCQNDANLKIRAFLFESPDIWRLEEELAKNGFELASEDIWEYLASSGDRTLFRTGEWVDTDRINLPHVIDNANAKFDIREPNLFGLTIGFDPYDVELVKAPIYFKGGDGGCALCGGASLFFGFLPVSPFFRMQTRMRDDYLEFLQSGELDRISYRRIFRLG